MQLEKIACEYVCLFRPFLTFPNNAVQTSTDVKSTPKIRGNPHYGRLMPGVPTSKCAYINAGQTASDVGKTPKMRGDPQYSIPTLCKPTCRRRHDIPQAVEGRGVVEDA